MLFRLEELIDLIVEPVGRVELDEVSGSIVHDELHGREICELGGIKLSAAFVGGAVVFVGDPGAEYEDGDFDFRELRAEVGAGHFDHGFGEGGAVGGGGDAQLSGDVFG